MALFGTAAAGVTLFGASDPAMNDRARLTTAGMAGIFGAASAMSGFRVWSAINAGVVAGAIAAIGVDHLRGAGQRSG